MRALPVLADRRAALETCAFCPKLCRGACPVSTAQPRETITPWGKMTTAWMLAHGDLALAPATAAAAWACTGCFGCREACAHRNPVAETLDDARAALAAVGLAPAAAARVVARFGRHASKTREAARRLNASALHGSVSARDALFVGCVYLRAAPNEARAAVDVASEIAGAGVAAIEACCGLPLRLAGDRAGFERHAKALAKEFARFERVFVVDPGCALALARRDRDGAGVDFTTKTVLLVDAAARELARRPARPATRAVEPTDSPVRWHDPCALGRGLGVYDAPRDVLTRALGRAPDEFHEARADASCSGGGGLLPATMPDVARAIGGSRAAAHREAGSRGGRIVTGCGASLLNLRRSGAGVAVDDVVTWAARALRES
jgi:Fe-S oxidoreductase